MNAEAVAPAAAAVQNSLPLPLVGELGEDAAGEPAPLPARSSGRQPGAKNRKTREWVDYVLKRYKSPLVALAETFNRPVEDLAEYLGCSKLEAFDRQLRAMEHLAPYLHQKLPTAVEFTGSDGIPLVLSISPAMAGSIDEPGATVDQDGRLLLEGRIEDVSDQPSEKGS